MRSRPLADCCYGAAILTMPLAGVGLIHLVLGVDVGAGLQPAYLLLALAWLLRWPEVVAWLAPPARGAGQGNPLPRPALAWTLAVLFAVALSGLGLVLAPAPVLAGEVVPRFFKQIVQLAVMAAFMAYPALWTRGPRRWNWTFRLLAWAIGVQLAYAGLLAIHQTVGLPSIAALDRAATSNPAILAGSERLYLGGYTAVPRLRGSMCEPLYLGSLLVATVPLLACSGRRLLTLGAGLGLLLTWSRSAWLAAAGALALWWLLRRRGRLPGPSPRVLLAMAGVGVVGVGLVACFAGSEVLAWPWRRLLQTLDRADWSNLTRYYSFQAAWRCFLESPVVGVGWGQYPFHFYALVDLPGLESQFTWPVVNSVPLLVLAETGLVGFGVSSALVILVARRLWRALAASADPTRTARLAALGAACGGIGLQLLLFSQYNLPHLWFVPGLLLAALAEAREGR